MNYINNATLIKRELIIKLARLFFQNRVERIDRIPIEMFPKNGSSLRCCIHKDRAIIKYRLMALLGHRVEEEKDELISPLQYAEEALEREKIEQPVLTVIDEACSACVKTNYFVSNACQGCVARPCMLNCRKDAISMVEGKAKIDPKKCVNCGLCMNECPYHAIIYMPVPCEEACPVGAITKDEYGKEHIDYSKCTFCGQCMRECPFGAIMERSQIIDVIKNFGTDKKLIAMIAPAIAGQFSANHTQVITALKQLGFDEVVEVAFGADMTAVNETKELLEKWEKGERFMTSSCCPAFIETVEKHIPELKEFVSNTPSPMHFSGAWVKENYPDAATVFIGPCLAKRSEGLKDPTIDYVLSIEELGALFVAKEIDVQKCVDSDAIRIGTSIGRGFPVTGGVTNAIRNALPDDKILNAVTIDGLNKKSIRELKRLSKSCDCNYAEVMACEGGCLAGPNVISNPKLSKRSLEKLLNEDVATVI